MEGERWRERGGGGEREGVGGGLGRWRLIKGGRERERGEG